MDTSAFIDEYTERQSQIIRWMRSDEYKLAFNRAFQWINTELLLHMKTLYIFGNGGSSANADHAALDFTKSSYVLQQSDFPKRLKCVSLASNSGFLSACTNDLEPDTEFSFMLNSVACRSDAAIMAMSVSGTSPNIRKLMAHAADLELPVLLLTGSGPRMAWGKKRWKSYGAYREERGSGNNVVHIRFPGAYYGVVEDAHMAFCHQLLEAVVTSLNGNTDGFKSK